MADSISVRQLHDRIVETNEFELLQPYRDPKAREKLGAEELQLLADLFILHGEAQLEAGDNEAVASFEIAKDLSPDDPQLHYWLGMLYASRSNTSAALKKAEACLQRAVELEPDLADAWHAWGHMLMSRAEVDGKSELLKEASEKLETAQSCLSNDAPLAAELFWDHGRCNFIQANQGEDLDLLRATLEDYRKAEKAGMDHAAFWFDFGEAALLLGTMLDSTPLREEALSHFQQSVQMADDFSPAWVRLGVAGRQLFEIMGVEDLFHQADRAFAQAAELGGEEALIWREWAKLYYVAGLSSGDPNAFEAALEKFSTADLYASGDVETIKTWILALVNLGIAQERLDLLREAEEKALSCVELAKDDMEVWIAYSATYDALGRYFGDPEYYQQAIQGLQYALNQFPENGLILQHLGRIYLSVGVLQQSPDMLRQADSCFHQAYRRGIGFSPLVLDDWGMALMHMADITGDAELAERAVEKLDPHVWEDASFDGDELALHLSHYGLALDLLGDLTGREEHYQKAVEALTQVVQLQPSDSFAHFSLGMALSHLGSLIGDDGSLEQSVHCFTQAAEIEPDEEPIYNEWGLALVHRAQLLDPVIHEDDWGVMMAEAETRFARAAQLGSGHAFYHLAVLYSLCGRQDAAIELLQRAQRNEGLPPVGEMLDDEWLAGLRETSEFHEFISSLQTEATEEEF